MSEIKLIGTSNEDPNIGELLEDAVQIITTSKRIDIPASKFRTASAKNILQQDCVLQPFKAGEILRFIKLDSTYQACLNIKRNTNVGIGYEIKENEIDRDHPLAVMLKQPNDNTGETFTQIMGSVYMDLDTFDNGYLEFIKFRNSRALYYIPAHSVFIKPHKDANGLNKRSIKEYLYMDSQRVIKSYKPYPADGKTKDGVSYLIHFKRPSQDSVYYGTPTNDHLHDLIRQNYLSDQYNINFFSNGAQPSYAAIITGASLSKKAQKNLQEYMQKGIEGVANAHKMLFMSFPDEKAKVNMVKLSQAIDEQFITLGDKIKLNIALKKGVPPKLLGISQGGNFGGGSAGIADMQIYIETISKPDQGYLEDVLNNVFYLEFGIDPRISFNTIDISNAKDDAIIANMYWNMFDEYGNRVLGINEIRNRFLKLKSIDLVHTDIDESKLQDLEPTISVNEQGKPRSNIGELDSGDRGDINNLNPDKNKK